MFSSVLHLTWSRIWNNFLWEDWFRSAEVKNSFLAKICFRLSSFFFFSLFSFLFLPAEDRWFLLVTHVTKKILFLKRENQKVNNSKDAKTFAQKVKKAGTKNCNFRKIKGSRYNAKAVILMLAQISPFSSIFVLFVRLNILKKARLKLRLSGYKVKSLATRPTLFHDNLTAWRTSVKWNFFEKRHSHIFHTQKETRIPGEY